MALDDIINVNVRVSASGPARTNFGTVLLAVQHALTGRPLVEAFGSLSEAVVAGHVVDSAAYKMLSIAFSQQPRPKQIKVGRRAPRVQTIRIAAVETLPGNGVRYAGEIDGEAWEYVVSGAASLAAQMTAIASAINALDVAVTATAASTYVDVASASGSTHTYETTALAGVMTMTDQSGDTNVAADLAAFAAFDDDFYGGAIDTASEADNLEAAAWFETQKKIFVGLTHDAAVVVGATTTDVGSDMKAANYARTHLQWTRKVGNLINVALLAQRSTANPGSDTWAYKALRGVTTDRLTTAEENALIDKNVNYYTTLKGEPATLNGVSPAGEFIDVVRGTDWLISRIQDRCLGALLANEKIDYDEGGIAVFASEVAGQCEEAMSPAHRFLSAYSVIVPEIEDVSADDKAARILRELNFTGTIRGAIHKLVINGTLSF
jgi:hypothetical protein